MTLLKALSGCLSNASPQVAPALANRMSTLSVCLATSAARRSISEMLLLSAGTEMALASGCLFGRALRAAQASSHALALREVMKTLEQPAWRRLHRTGSARRFLQASTALAGQNSPRRGVQA